MSKIKFKNARLQIERASEHIQELNELISKKPPFTYCVETDTYTRMRATFAKQNEAVIDQISTISGEVVHCLRTALNYVYWDIVSPFVSGESEERQLDFPFKRKRDVLEKSLNEGLANRVGQEFIDAILAIKPYEESGGDALLWLINEIDNPRKHRFPTPVGDYTKLSSNIISRQVPDFPRGIESCGFGSNRRDVGWSLTSPDPNGLGEIVPPFLVKFERVLDVPVDVVFNDRSSGDLKPVMSTIQAMLNRTCDVINSLEIFV